MPNWCENRLSVSGPKVDAWRFRETAKSRQDSRLEASALSFQSLVPMPKELEGTTSPDRSPLGKKEKALRAKLGFTNWYDWSITNWGIKWDVTVSNPEELQGFEHDTRKDLLTLNYEFLSPWGPPENAIKKIAQLFPTLTFCLEYCEPGNNFSGILTIDKGEIVQEEYHDDIVWDELKEEFPDGIIEESDVIE